MNDHELDTETEDRVPEEIVANRDQLALLIDCLREELSPRGWQLFELLFVQDLSQAQVEAASGLSAAAVYAWGSRLRHVARKLLAEETQGRREGHRRVATNHG
jgi:DNA-directed RNA polymerase specialized sigma24 family protein